MDEDEAALLAELRAISQKSAASRFDDDDDDNNGAAAAAAAEHHGVPLPAATSTGPDSTTPLVEKDQGNRQQEQEEDTQSNDPSKNKNRASTPPWKQRKKKVEQRQQPSQQTQVDVDVDVVDTTAGAEPKADESSTPSKKLALPWKRNPPSKRENPDKNADAPSAAASLPDATATTTGAPKYGIKSDVPSTFQGERGGAAEDAELLALLRGVSAKSGASRFNDDQGSGTEGAAPETANTSSSKADDDETAKDKDPSSPKKLALPWKRNPPKRETRQQEDEVLVAPTRTATLEKSADTNETPPPVEPTYGIQSDVPSTFQGERGGAAEDAELLALLRGVSAKSGGSRFDEGEEEEESKAIATESKPEGTAANEKTTPPWRRKVGMTKRQPDVDVAVAAPPSAIAREDSEAAAVSEQPAAEPKYGIKSDRPSTFRGERGGAAEDAELLALLRGVSSKSGASRFDDDNDEGGGAASESQPSEAQKPQAKPSETKGLEKTAEQETAMTKEQSPPPWKRAGTKPAPKKETEVDVAVAAPPSPMPHTDSEQIGEHKELPIEAEYRGIKSDVPSTFQGERGGAAEDAELLALLRNVSSKSASSRFNDPEVEDTAIGAGASDASTQPTSATAETPNAVFGAQPTSQRNVGAVPPWKRGGRKVSDKQADTDVVIAAPAAAPPQRPSAVSESKTAPAPSHGIKSDLPSTFKGERGGAAEDAELLALLRGVTSQSASSRFSDDPGAAAAADNGSRPADPTERSPDKKPSVAAVQEILAPSNGESLVSKETVSLSLGDKNWKVRSQAFEMLTAILKEAVDSSHDLVDSDSVLEDLDDRIFSFVEDSNANALDKALDFAKLYAESCRGAGDAERAGKIVSSLLKKNAFSSRPTTLKLASALTLKLMEVGSEGVASVHSVVDVLLKEGLASRKPKVVQASASLILDAAVHFGAASLPLALVTDSAPKMLSHSNAKVREGAVKTLAEICRVLGTKATLQGVIDGMKKAQVSELDALLSSQPEPTPVKTGLRSQARGSSSGDALAAMQAGAKELEAQRFAARPAIDVVAAVAKSDYSQQIALPKWSQKVAALNTVIECAGEKPYKLAQPSSSVNYSPLIVDMRKLLSHTHFAVCSKAMEVLSMLAEGVGEKLFPHLRPALAPLLQISKDKKLTRAVEGCLDSLFGNVVGFEHLLDKDDALPSALDEQKQKNALARSTALRFIGRCVERNESAGPRGSLCTRSAAAVAALCSEKLSDSDASVRKAAMDVFYCLQQLNDENIVDVVRKEIDSLETANPRAYKTLAKSGGPKAAASKSVHTTASVTSAPLKSSTPSRSRAAAPIKKTTAAATVDPSTKTSMTNAAAVKKSPASSDDVSIPHLEEALVHVSGLRIPQWDAPDEEGGIFEGLKSSKWLLRQDAIRSLTAFVESGHLVDSENVEKDSSSILLVVREQTRAFNETNVNIMKAIIQLFIAVCEFNESKECSLSKWVVRDSAAVCVKKISDRKLSGLCQNLLTALCVVSLPSSLVLAAFENLKSVKSPVAHEEFLKWFLTFFRDFGAESLGPEISEIVPHLIEELASSTAKVQREATTCFAMLHQQIGPGLKALAMSLAKQQSLKTQLEKCFDDNPFDASDLPKLWPKESIAFQNAAGQPGQSHPSQRLALTVPKTNLLSLLPDDIVAKLGSKEGKTAWKMRKEALEEIESAIVGCSGLIETDESQMRQLVELIRGLRDRLSDTQINLRPIAARTVGSMLSAVEKSCQAKLGKIVFATLINAAMNDIKKPLRDASLTSIKAGITASDLDGGGLNELALEYFVAALVSEVNETAIRAGGLPDVLLLLQSFVEHLPNLDGVVSARGLSLGEKYAQVIVECLTSSKSETRSAAQSLLEASFANGIVGLESIRKAQGRLKPATQRSVAPIIAKITSNAPGVLNSEDNLKSDVATTEVPGRRIAASRQREGSLAPATAQRTQAPSSRSDVARASPRVASPSHGSRHPLVPRSGKHITESTKSILWPVFPEEPHGSVLGSLKRFWSPLLPPTSASALFPSSGIKKQDDAKGGCELLASAMSLDRSEGTAVVAEQLDLILKWTIFALCSKETTTGLQDILSLAKNLFTYMRENRREFTDAEALETVPFILEKASFAKGRFRDVYMEITALVESEELLPAKRLGSVVCVAMMDGSTHAKSRASACETCIACVEKIGLAGVGKKGVLSAAKLLSQESTKYRGSVLDLMEVILSKMNGDMQRLVRICGPNLTEKARQLLQERVNQDRPTRGSSPAPTRTPAYHHRSPSGSPVKSHKVPGSRARSTTREPDLYDELPKLSLRSWKDEPQRSSPTSREAAHDTEDEPFAFSLSAFRETSPPSKSESEVVTEGTNVGQSASAASSSAAASLRARLLKIRERSTVPGGVVGGKTSDSAPANIGATSTSARHSADFDGYLDSIHNLLSKNSPVFDQDAELMTCISSLKIFHAALSRQQHSTVGLSVSELADVRTSLVDNMNIVVDCLRRLITFAFSSGDASVNAGILLPLLSLCLATLMALFRDGEFAAAVSTEEMTLLLRETGVALLDARLSSSDQLNEETGSQMVRAINKLAVQAATGASRHAAFQALLTLQLQLNLNVAPDEDAAFAHRLSRVMTKLFARVIRAEEASDSPFTQERLDMEALICSTEDYLVSCQRAEQEESAPSRESLEICYDMAKTLIVSILDAHGSSTQLRQLMEDLEMTDDGNSALGELVAACEDELGLPRQELPASSSTSRPPHSIDVAASPYVTSSPANGKPSTPSRDVAILVSKLGSAPAGDEREAALEEIRRYKASHGDEEIRAHLQQLSGPFREFIEEQLEGNDPSPQKAVSLDLTGTSSVSERIRSLRSRLQVTEMAVQNAVEEKPSPDVASAAASSLPPKARSSPPKESKLAAPSPSRLASPAPSKLPTPTQSRLPAIGSSSQSLRERLTARRIEGTAAVADSSAGAAALRARLEAVKKQSQLQ